MERNSAVRAWATVARSWWRSKRSQLTWSLVIVGVLAGATAGFSLAAVDGARRTATVLARVSDAEKSPDVMILPDRPDFDWAPIARLPEIAVLGRIGGPVCALDVGKGALCGSVGMDESFGRDIETGGITEGREPAPTSTSEVIVNRAAAVHYGLGVGDSLTIVAPTHAQLEKAFATFRFPSTSEFGGRHIKARVVGVAEPSLTDRLLGDPDGVDAAEFYVGRAFAKLQPDAFVVNAFARLEPGTDVAALRRAIAKVTGDPALPVRDLTRDRDRYDRTLLIERSALILLAIVLLLVGAMLIGQALIRVVSVSAADVDTLVVLGASRATAIGVVAAPFVVVVVAAVVVALAGAAAVSTRFPIGTARLLDPHAGVHLDALILGVGLAALVLALVACVALAARAAVGRRQLRLNRARKRAPLPVPLPVELGVRFAVARGGSAGRAGTTPAIIGAVVGVLGIVGAMTFRTGIDDVVAHHDRAGTTWDHVVNVPLDAKLPPLTTANGLRAAAEVVRAPIELGGQTVSAWSFEPKVGHLPRVVTKGRLPARPDEATLGWSTAQALGVGIGDRVTASNRATLTVVGIGLLPEQPGHSPYDRGLWVTTKGMARLEPPEIGDRELLVTLDTGNGAAGASRRAAAALAARLRAGGAGDLAVEPAVIPEAAHNLASVRRLPLALAGFLALLAAGVSANAIAGTVRSRRRELAVFRAVGLTPRQARGVIASQATTIGLVGLVAGVPLGLVVGRAGWQWVANSVPFVYHAPFAVVAAIAVVPAALVVVNLIGALPAHTAARVRTAEVLRAE